MAKQGENSPSSIDEPTATFSAISSSIPQVLRQALGHYKARRSWEKLDLTGDLPRIRNMRHLKYLVLLAICMLSLAAPSQAQVRVAVRVGGDYSYPPVCTYGYYGYYPYACAPYGYYGPDWFVGGVFIGAGPWYHDYYGRPHYYGRPGYYGRGFVSRGYGYGGRGGFDRGRFRGGRHR